MRIKFISTLFLFFGIVPADIVNPNYHSVETIRYIDNLSYFPMYRFFGYIEKWILKNNELYEIKQDQPLKKTNIFDSFELFAIASNNYDSTLLTALNFKKIQESGLLAAVAPKRGLIRTKDELFHDSSNIVKVKIYYSITKIVNKTIFLKIKRKIFTTKTGQEIVKNYDSEK